MSEGGGGKEREVRRGKRGRGGRRAGGREEGGQRRNREEGEGRGPEAGGVTEGAPLATLAWTEKGLDDGRSSRLKR